MTATATPVPSTRSGPPSDNDRVASLFFAVLFVSTLLVLLYVMRDFIGDIVVAFILVGLIRRPYEWLLQCWPRSPWLASGLMTLLVGAVLVLPLVGLGFTIAAEARAVVGASDNVLNRGGELIARTLAGFEEFGLQISRTALLERLGSATRALERTSIAAGGALLSNVLGLSFHLLVVLVMVFYIRVDGERLRRFLYALSPLPDEEDALLEETFRKVARGVVLGQGLGSALQGLLGGLSFWLAGLSSPILWGTIMGIAAFLPLVGVTFIAIPAGLWLYATGHPVAALTVVAFNVLQGTIIDNVVKTKLVGSSMRMHDLLVFLSMLGGITAFGLIGMVYGPLIAMLFMTLTDLYGRVYRPRLAERLNGTHSPVAIEQRITSNPDAAIRAGEG